MRCDVPIIRSLLHRRDRGWSCQWRGQGDLDPSRLPRSAGSPEVTFTHSARTWSQTPTPTPTRPTRERRLRMSYSMSDPSITVAEAFKQFSQVTVSAVGPGSILPAFSSSNYCTLLLVLLVASRLRAWDSRETHSGRGRSARAET